MSEPAVSIASEPLPDVMNDQMTTVLKYWESKCEGAAFGPFPTLADLNIMDLFELIGNLVICEVIRPEPNADNKQVRYRWRYWGSELSTFFGVEMTGKYLDEAYTPTTAQQICSCYDWILENRKIHYWQRRGGSVQENAKHFTFDNQNPYKGFERLACPVIDQTGEISHLFGIITFMEPNTTASAELDSDAIGEIFQSD